MPDLHGGAHSRHEHHPEVPGSDSVSNHKQLPYKANRPTELAAFPDKIQTCWYACICGINENIG